MSADPTPRIDRKKLQHRLGLIFLGLCLIWMFSVLTQTPLLETGTVAPEWSLVRANADRDKMSLSDLEGKVVVLDFWSIGCPPCVREIDELEAVHRQFEGKDVAVIGVAAWGETAEDIREFRKGRRISYPLLLGTQSMVDAYQASTLPTLYLLDRTGRIARSHQGYWPRDELAAAITELLAEAPAD